MIDRGASGAAPTPASERGAHLDLRELARRIPAWGRELGFVRVGICDIDLRAEEAHLLDWLLRGFEGGMHSMRRHGARRACPAELRPGTVRVISVAMGYLPRRAAAPLRVLGDYQLAYISRYALGRDYHKPLRRRLQHLADRIGQVAGPFGYRVFATVRQCWRRPWRAKPVLVGSASTRSCCTRALVPDFSWGKSIPIYRYRSACLSEPITAATARPA